MGKRRKRKTPDPLMPPPKLENLEGIAILDARRSCLNFVLAAVVEFVFQALYVPFANPPLWVAWTVRGALYGYMVFMVLANLLDAGYSVYLHFRQRFRTKT
jgi:hypothetical protein